MAATFSLTKRFACSPSLLNAVADLGRSQWSGADYADNLLKTVTGGVSSTAAMGAGVTYVLFFDDDEMELTTRAGRVSSSIRWREREARRFVARSDCKALLTNPTRAAKREREALSAVRQRGVGSKDDTLHPLFVVSQELLCHSSSVQQLQDRPSSPLRASPALIGRPIPQPRRLRIRSPPLSSPSHSIPLDSIPPDSLVPPDSFVPHYSSLIPHAFASLSILRMARRDRKSVV